MMDQNYLVEKLTEYRNRELKASEKNAHVRYGGKRTRSLKGWLSVLAQTFVKESSR
ncbi:hypothetical protein [Cohnella thailandensis]|uniref:Uncharacterized protein n=1 Tax=Cohnella thailandensis TaxID=557557 RepID=A0A841T1V0_9BACL|nr:hypothetical protein [Cohnella thailandensis]MBB6638373.1 hypothetical protein [Cohnella thailandensis]MBP1977149.1 hypothetical protein [Cohnella thailandensis]